MSDPEVLACPNILAPETQNCSGRGVCTSADSCSCPEGWTGVGDFAFRSPSCAINIATVRALWAMAGSLSALVFFFALYYTKVKIAQKSRSKSPVLLGVLVTVATLFIWVTGWIRAISPLRSIGSDTAVTVTFVIGVTGFWSAAHVFIYSFIALNIKQSRVFRSKEETNDRTLAHLKVSLPISNVLTTIGCLMPLGMLGATNSYTVSSLATAHYVILALELAVTGLWLTPLFVRGLLKEIKDVSAKQNAEQAQTLHRVILKMERFLAELRNQAITNVICAGLFGFWPFLQVYGSSYFLPFAWTSGTIVSALGLYLNLPVSKDSAAKGSSTVTGDKDSQVKPMSSAASSTRNMKANGPKALTVHDSYVEQGSVA